MKIRLFAALMIALMAITILAGCQASANAIPSQRPAESTPEAVPTTAAPVVAESLPTQAAPTRITAEEAEAIALSHAGIAAEQVSYMRTEFDYDDGRPEYDIEFYSDGWEYDYEIHAETGEILRHETEPPKEQKKAAEPASTVVQPAETKPAETKAPAAAEPKRLSKEEVISIALKHAGLSRDQVKGLRAEFDYDDGRPEYDIEFRYDGWEYDYEIHAETGEILSWDKDRDD